MNYTYNTFTERDNKRKQYLDFLDNKIANNKFLADKYQNSFYYQQMGMQQPTTPTRSVEEELQDFSKQREIAFKNLREITDTESASAILTRLTSLENIVEFNSYFGMFKESIRGQSNITPSIFETLWKQFRDRLRDEGKLISRLPTETPELGDLQALVEYENLNLPPEYKKSPAIQDIEDEFNENADKMKTPVGQLEFIYKFADRLFPARFSDEIREFIFSQEEKNEVPEIIIDEVNKLAKPYIQEILTEGDLVDSKVQATQIANKGIVFFADYLTRQEVEKEAKQAFMAQKQAEKVATKATKRAKKQEKRRVRGVLEGMLARRPQVIRERGLKTELKGELEEKLAEASYNTQGKLLYKRAQDLVNKYLPAEQREGAMQNIGRRFELRGAEDVARFLTEFERKQEQIRIPQRAAERQRLRQERLPLIEEIKQRGKMPSKRSRELEQLGMEPEIKSEFEQEQYLREPQQTIPYQLTEQINPNSDSYRYLQLYMDNIGVLNKRYQGENVENLYLQAPNEDERLKFLAKMFIENYNKKYKTSVHNNFLISNASLIDPLFTAVGYKA